MSANGGAGLLELVARGKKDTFFSGEPKISFFHSVYRRALPWLRETRYLIPRNEVDFGSYADFYLEPVGDFIKDIYLLINLPTWLPANIAALNGTSLVQDLSGNSWGYTNSCGYYCIDKIQLFQNQLMIYEDYGEAMYLRGKNRLKIDNSAVLSRLSGAIRTENAFALGLQRNATPGQLEIRLQLPCDNLHTDFGIPVGALQSFSMKVRVYLHPVSRIIQNTAGSLSPNPFAKTFQIKTSSTGSFTQFQTKDKKDFGKPHLQIRAQYVYIDGEAQRLLRDNEFYIPIKKCVKNEFTLEDYFFNSSSAPTLRKNMEIYGSAHRLQIVFQTSANYLAGACSDYSPVSGSWFTTLTLLIHGFDRLGIYDPTVFETVTPYCHNNGIYLSNVYQLDLGSDDLGIPAGTLNFTEAEKPELQITMFDQIADPRTDLRKTYLRVYADTWDILFIGSQIMKLPFV